MSPILRRPNMYSRCRCILNNTRHNLFDRRSNEKLPMKLTNNFAKPNIENLTLKDLIGFLFGLVCVICLVICTYLTILQFVNYRTKVSYHLEDARFLDLPGLTFCLPTFIPSVILQQLFPEYKFISEQIRIAIKEKKIKVSNYPTLLSLLKSIGIAEETIKELNISESLKPERFQAFYEWKALKKWTAIQAFEYSSKPFFKKCSVEAEYFLEEVVNNNDTCDRFGEPLESIIDDRKCFTYFTQLNSGNKSEDLYRVDMKKPFRIIISIVEKPDIWLAFQSAYVYYQNIRLYVHPPNIIPAKDEIDFILLESGQHYDIRYTNTVSRLMKKPYVTDCNSYDLGNGSQLQSRSDCLDKCLLDNMYSFNFDFDDSQPRCIDVNFGTRRDLLTDNDRLCNMRFDVYRSYEKGTFNDKVYDVRMNCLTLCKRDCVDVMYDVNVMKSGREFGEIHMWIGHKSGPYTVVEHSPEISNFNLFSDLSAFGSLWIGFSVFNLYVWVTNGFKFFYRYCLKFKSHKHNNNNLNYRHNNVKMKRISQNNSPYNIG